MTDSGSTVTDAVFNMDVDLQMVNMESTVSGQGSFSVLLDYKGVSFCVFIFFPVQN